MDDPGPLELAWRLMNGARHGQLDPLEAILHPDVEWYGSVGGLEPGTAYGPDGVRRSFLEYRGTWERLSFEDQAIVVSGDRALVVARERARGVGSGVDVEQGNLVLLTTSAGRITRMVTYLDLPRGFADFGISDEVAARIVPGKAYELIDGELTEITGKVAE